MESIADDCNQAIVRVSVYFKGKAHALKMRIPNGEVVEGSRILAQRIQASIIRRCGEEKVPVESTMDYIPTAQFTGLFQEVED